MSYPAFTIGWVLNLTKVPSSSNALRDIIFLICLPVLAFVALLYQLVPTDKDNSRQSGQKMIRFLSLFTSMSSSIAYSGIAISQTKVGLGLHAFDLPADDVIPYSKRQYFGGPVYCLGILGNKIALIELYLHIFGVQNSRFNRSCLRVFQLFVVASQVAFMLVFIFQCQPIKKVWDSTVEGHCVEPLSFYYALGGTSLFGDLVILSLPLYGLFLKAKVRQTTLENDETTIQRGDHYRKQNRMLVLLFSLGFCLTITQAVRIPTIALLKVYTDSENIILLSSLEINLGIVMSNPRATRLLLETLQSFCYRLLKTARRGDAQEETSKDSDDKINITREVKLSFETALITKSIEENRRIYWVEK